MSKVFELVPANPLEIVAHLGRHYVVAVLFKRIPSGPSKILVGVSKKSVKFNSLNVQFCVVMSKRRKYGMIFLYTACFCFPCHY